MKRTASILVALALFLGACGGSSDDGPEAGSRSDGTRTGGGGHGKSGDGAPGDAANGPGKDGGSDNGSDAAGGGGGDRSGGGGGTTNSDDAYAIGSSTVEEPSPDAEKEGLPPDYAEALAASIEGLGKNFRLTITFDGDLPDKLPDDKTIMIVSFGMKKNDKDHGYAFLARCQNDGWHLSSGGKEESEEYPGEFELDGNQMVFTIPWSYVKGPYKFQWSAGSSWYQQLANTARYSFDPIPNSDAARYPD